MRAQGVTYDFVGAYRQYMRDHFSEMVNNAATFINNNIQGELTYWASQAGKSQSEPLQVSHEDFPRR